MGESVISPREMYRDRGTVIAEDFYRDSVIEALAALQEGDTEKAQRRLAELLEDLEGTLGRQTP